jgi:hypothetical protein
LREVIESPYLIMRSPGQGDGCVTVTADVHTGVIAVSVHGPWTPALRVRTWAAVTKCFAEHPRAVLVDLQCLQDPLAASAPAWWTMAMTGARMVPPVAVVVCLPPGTALGRRLNRLGARRTVPVFASMPEAREALALRVPLTDRVQLDLSPQPDASARALALVAGVCQAWHLPQLRQNVELIMSELVDNAVRHAGTDILVVMARRGAGISLRVSDDDLRLPAMLDAPHGLHRVHAAATVWGAMPTTTGKIVWALVRS